MEFQKGCRLYWFWLVAVLKIPLEIISNLIIGFALIRNCFQSIHYNDVSVHLNIKILAIFLAFVWWGTFVISSRLYYLVVKHNTASSIWSMEQKPANYNFTKILLAPEFFCRPKFGKFLALPNSEHGLCVFFDVTVANFNFSFLISWKERGILNWWFYIGFVAFGLI